MCCLQCDTHVGRMRDAKLRKGIVFLCGSCNQDRIATEESSGSAGNTRHIKGNSDEEIGEALRRGGTTYTDVKRHEQLTP